MKKILTLFTVLCVSTLLVSGQSISLSNADGPIPNDGIMMVSGDMNLPMVAHVFVTNNTSSGIDVMVKKVIIDTVPGTSNFFCWVLCYPPNIYEPPDAMGLGPNQTNSSSFTGDYDAAGIKGISKIRYVFYIKNHPTDSACVQVFYNAGYLGTDDVYGPGVRFSAAYPNPASSLVSFNYQLPADGSANAFVRVVNLLGEEVANAPLAESNGKLDLPVGDLQKGIYFYSLLVNGESLVTRKLVIR